MSHLQTVQSIYQAFGRGDIPAIVDRLSARVEWEHDAVNHGIPWLVPGRGLDHVMSFFGAVGKELDISQFEVLRLFESGPQVVGVIRLGATVRSTGKPLRDLELHLWTFGEDGKVERFRHVVDTHAHWLASRST